MLPFKNILSPTDFSEPSYKAIKVANELALHFSARLVVLHVVSLTPAVSSSLADAPGFDVAAYQKELEDDARRQMREVVEKMISRDLGNCIPKITRGSYPMEILRIAREEKSDLIVIGTRGRTGIPHLVLGSVAERVVQLAPCPVLTIGPTVSV
jgi:nucleotide-binding universal stress UspA family protein